MRKLLSKNKNVLIYALAFFLFFVFDFSLNSILSFKLGKGEYLFYQKILNVLPLITTLVGLGFSFSITYITARKNETGNNYLLYQANNLIIKVVMVALTISFLVFLFDANYLYLLVSIVLGGSLAIKQNTLSLYLGRKALIKASVIRILPKLIFWVLVVITVITLKFVNDYSFGVLLVFAEFLSLFLLHLRFSIFNFRESRGYVKRLFSYGKYAFLSNLSSLSIVAFPIVFMTDYLNLDKVTVIEFSIAYTLLRYSSFLLAPFMQLIIPYFASESRKEVIDKMFVKYSLVLLVLGIIALIGAYLLSEFIITTFFEKKYYGALQLFRIFCINIPFMFLANFSFTAISSIWKINYLVKIQVLLSLFVLFLGSFLILEYHQYGALYMIMVYNVLETLFNYTIFYKLNSASNKRF